VRNVLWTVALSLPGAAAGLPAKWASVAREPMRKGASSSIQAMSNPT